MEESIDFSDVATSPDISRIADAVRAVTKTTAPMTIPEMPGRMLGIKVVEVVEKTLSFASSADVSLGTYDTVIKHLFLVLPKNDDSAAVLADIEPNVALTYNEQTGELFMSHAETSQSTATVLVVDMLLSIDSNTIGVVVSAGSSAGASSILAYSASKSYAVGDIFLYDGVLGVTSVAHGPEVFNASHNKLMATRYMINREGTQEWVDLFELSEALERMHGRINDQDEAIEDIREVAEGKTKSFVLSYAFNPATSSVPYQIYRKYSGELFNSQAEFDAYISGKQCINSIFNSQNVQIESSVVDRLTQYLVLEDVSLNDGAMYTIMFMSEMSLKTGDVFLVTEVDVPDRWQAGDTAPGNEHINAYKLETAKVPVTDVRVNNTSVVSNNVANIPLNDILTEKNINNVQNEVWTFVLDDDTTVTKTIKVGS